MPLTSFYTALTGLNNNATAISVIGNNLANMNTGAFKGSKASFAEALAGAASSFSSSGSPIQVGLGSLISGISPVFTQGSITYTGRPTDAAISGSGFFVVSTEGGVGFTRSGSFGLSNLGELINSEGLNVLGYRAVNGIIGNYGDLTPVVINKGESIPPTATANISIAANLDAQTAVDSTFATAVQVYDSLGAVHVITLSFTKTGTGGWDWTAAIPATDTGGASGDPPVQIGNGALVFDGAGRMTSPTANATLTVAGLSSGAADMDVTFNLLDAIGNPLITSYAGSSSVSSTTQDGSASSLLIDVTIDSRGMLNGVFDDGRTMPIAQLAIANFANVEGLGKYRGNTFVESQSSGAPSIGIAGDGGRGVIVGASLEQSNVDIAQEFTNLIVSQRGYQANSRVITTTDELYQDALSLKR